ncbi:helix-turn-helix domain-containing protein [Gemmatimonas sp.]|uniref:helix-turn-helix domain-containing protein n=1 Tax=Gemmatimonas sp. TaxID=1962908 RepID=UPI003983322B
MPRRPPTPVRLRRLGRRIAELRLAVGVTQERLAEKTGAAISWIKAIEAGSRDIRVSTMWRLADALGVEPEEVLAIPASMRVARGRPRKPRS